jgi:hypothetical protein
VPSKLPRSYLIRDIEFISADISPRFSIRMKSRYMDGGEGETMKLSADTEAERVAWMRVLHKMKESAPQAEEDDDPYRECSARAAGVGWAGQAGGPSAQHGLAGGGVCVCVSVVRPGAADACFVPCARDGGLAAVCLAMRARDVAHPRGHRLPRWLLRVVCAAATLTLSPARRVRRRHTHAVPCASCAPPHSRCPLASCAPPNSRCPHAPRPRPSLRHHPQRARVQTAPWSSSARRRSARWGHPPAACRLRPWRRRR